MNQYRIERGNEMHVGYKAETLAIHISHGNTFSFLLKIVIANIFVFCNGIVQQSNGHNAKGKQNNQETDTCFLIPVILFVFCHSVANINKILFY